MKRRWWIWVWGALGLATSWLAGCAGSAIPSQALNSRPVLLADRLGTAQDLIPTEAEIAAAKTALGTKGFIGIVACNLSSEYHATVPRAAQALASKLGLRIDRHGVCLKKKLKRLQSGKWLTKPPQTTPALLSNEAGNVRI